MAEKKVLNLTLNDQYIDRIMDELKVMKDNNNKIIKITNNDKSIVLVMNHVDNELVKKRMAARQEKNKKE